MWWLRAIPYAIGLVVIAYELMGCQRSPAKSAALPPPQPLSPAQRAQLQNWGLKGQATEGLLCLSSDSYTPIENLASDFYLEPSSSPLINTAFQWFAQLGGNPTCIDGDDFVSLALPKALAQVLKGDPVNRWTASGGIFKHTKKGADTLGYYNRPALSDPDATRTLSYMQYALGHFQGSSNLPVTGSYDAATHKAITAFQDVLGIKRDVKGAYFGDTTLAAVVLHLDYTPETLVAAIDAQAWDLSHREGKENQRFDLSHSTYGPQLVRALQFFYPGAVNPSIPVAEKAEGRFEHGRLIPQAQQQLTAMARNPRNRETLDPAERAALEKVLGNDSLITIIGPAVLKVVLADLRRRSSEIQSTCLSPATIPQPRVPQRAVATAK